MWVHCGYILSIEKRKTHSEVFLSGLLVEIVGVEPTTLCLQSRCSSQLSYTPVLIADANIRLIFKFPNSAFNFSRFSGVRPGEASNGQSVDRSSGKFLFNLQKTVIFRSPFGTAQRSGLYLTTVHSDGKVCNECIFRLA